MLPRIDPFTFGESAIHSGQTIQVTCLVSEGDLPLNITWTFNSVPLDSQSSVNPLRAGKKASLLLFDSVSEDQAGNYTCIAKNQAGSVSHSTTLNVYGILLFTSQMSWKIKCLMPQNHVSNALYVNRMIFVLERFKKSQH